MIGRDGQLPWREPEDLAFFKRTTLGHAILMGRKTHDSIGRALPGRRNLVISRDPSYRAPGCEVFGSFDAALGAARETDPCPYVIGGATVYEVALPLATILFVTEIPGAIPGDTWFPAIDANAWRETLRTASADGRLVFLRLERLASTTVGA